jgi:hypothetical protein
MPSALDVNDDDGSARTTRHPRGEFQYDQRGNVVAARVPMMLRDSAARDADRREVQRQIKTDSERREAFADRHRIVDGSGSDGLALRRPGARRMADASLYDAPAEAYAAMVADGEAAWKRGPGGNQQDATAPSPVIDGARTALDWRSGVAAGGARDKRRAAKDWISGCCQLLGCRPMAFCSHSAAR